MQECESIEDGAAGQSLGMVGFPKVIKPEFPVKSHTASGVCRILIAALLMMISGLCFSPVNGRAAESRASDNAAGRKVSVSQIEPDPRGGKAYRLIYLVQLPIDVYWKFKSDFDNDFLVTNKYIIEHRFISRSDDVALTEDMYTNAPDVFFRWRTRLYPKARRLEFLLLNPKECGQRFHHGYIQLEPAAGATKVTQVGYFDFWGASFWADYPWGGGMVDFLTYTARWEQDLALQLKERYVR